MLKNFFKYFAQGLLVIVPAGITLLLLYRVFDFISHYITALGIAFNSYLHPVLVFFIVLSIILLIGRFASTLFFQSLFGYFEKMVEQAPVVKHIYSPVKDFMNAFVGNKKKFNKPVLVTTNPAAGIEEIGFITQEDMSSFGNSPKIAVYMPHSYAFSGRLFIVPRENVRPVNHLSGGDAMKFIVSGGVSDLDADTKSGSAK